MGKKGYRPRKQTRTINGEKYRASTQHDSKSAAQKRAQEVRERGGAGRRLNARVVKSGNKYVVFVGGFSKGPHGWGYRKSKR